MLHTSTKNRRNMIDNHNHTMQCMKKRMHPPCILHRPGWIFEKFDRDIGSRHVKIDTQNVHSTKHRLNSRLLELLLPLVITLPPFINALRDESFFLFSRCSIRIR